MKQTKLYIIFISIMIMMMPCITKADKVSHSTSIKNYKKLGLHYKNSEKYSKSLNAYHKALNIQIKSFGKGDISTAETASSLGALYEIIADYPNAMKYTKNALEIRKKRLGEQHGDTAISYNNLANLYMTIGDYPKALKYHQKALAGMKRAYGETHEYTAASYNNLGRLYDIMGNYSKALKYYTISLTSKEKTLGENHISTAESYNNIGFLYRKMKQPTKALEYLQKALSIKEKILGENHTNTSLGYNNISIVYQDLNDYPKALKYQQKALTGMKKILGRSHPTTAKIYNNMAYLSESMHLYPEALNYYQKALAITEKISGSRNTYAPKGYINIAFVYQAMGEYKKAQHYAQLAFNLFLDYRDQVFTILSSKEKGKYLQVNRRYINFLLKYTYQYLTQPSIQNKTDEAQKILQSGANAWINYKGSIFDSENAIATLYVHTKDKKTKTQINHLLDTKRTLAKLYQTLPSPKNKNIWEEKIKQTEEQISTLTLRLVSKANILREQQGLASIKYTDITSHLEESELYIDYAKAEGYYYLFTLDHKETISFTQIDLNSSKKIDELVKIFRGDVNTVLKGKNLSREELEKLSIHSKSTLSKLYQLLIDKPLKNQVKSKKSLIISPDSALRLLPFEALYDQDHNKYLIEEKKIRYIPSGKELVRLYKYSKDITNKKDIAIIFSNPDFNTKIISATKKENNITPGTSRSGIIKSLFRMRFAPLPGTKAEAAAIRATLNQSEVKEYRQTKATESTLMKVKEPKILHIATHGFFINDNTIPNPMLKSGIALAGANASVIKGKSDGIVTALKLSGLNLKGTDLVVLSACETGVVDMNSTDSVSGLSKAFIQAGAKDILMSLWTVDDLATKDLMDFFYREVEKEEDYTTSLQQAKLNMIIQGKHPFYWAAFIVSGL